MIAALVPAKALDQAKGRLAALLSEDERRRLALAMLEDVVRALQGAARIGLIAVVSPDAEVLALARELGAQAIQEPSSVRGINQALSHALKIMSHRALDALLVVLADVPAVTPADIDAVLDALPADRGAVICPSHDRGTSVLAMRPPALIPFRFGAHSFPAHKREAAARGVPTAVLRLAALARDIDGPDDLRLLMSGPAGGAEAAPVRAGPATQRLLAELRVAGRAPG
ncbi:MAG: 2-phospho-L-lactate guanylyltransferase [Dehalococcoidia bacterium]|nr:2-phospho-L-lactate guanylyltransferase [Dehalococcoidia bacterium]